MNLNIREMLQGDPIRMRYVTRYSSYRITHPENVAEHSYYVVFYATMIAWWCEDLGEDIDWKTLMFYAMIHDVEESRSGDVPREFKYSDPELKKMLNQAADKAMVQLVGKLLSGGGPESLQDESDDRYDDRDWLMDTWRSAKSDTIEGSIVAFADFLSVLSCLVQEKESGNQFALQHAPSLIEYFQTFNEPRYAFLGSLLVDVEAFIAEHYSEYYHNAESDMPCVPRVHATRGTEPVLLSESELRIEVALSGTYRLPDGSEFTLPDAVRPDHSIEVVVPATGKRGVVRISGGGVFYHESGRDGEGVRATHVPGFVERDESEGDGGEIYTAHLEPVGDDNGAVAGSGRPSSDIDSRSGYHQSVDSRAAENP